ncbi:MAG: sulfur carrier protein ThiS [Nitrospirota bacterium]
MRLTINGSIFEAKEASTIMDLLDELSIKPDRVAVEVNLSIVRKADYSVFRLNEGDRVEIVNFVGGG